jgi:3-hydroxyacyl-CoA dehydrogenase
MYRIEKAAVIGAGTMGLGIAGQLANAGVEVLLLDLAGEGEDRNALVARALERLADERQPGLLHPDYLQRIHAGNIEDDLHRLAGADWITEAVVERLQVKRDLYRAIDAVRKPGSIVSSNTSTIPIALLVEGMPESFRRDFAITHFFNPVRFMRLLELVRGDDTQPEVIDCLARFNEERMGKGIVVCRDTPGFLANRVGVFAIQTALHAALRLGLKPEEADAIFGRPMGVPKTGVFGLYDLIGIDLMSDVASSLVGILPPDDAFHEVAGEIPLMSRMISAGRIGNKGREGGFYRYAEPGNPASRQTLDLERFEYRAYDHDIPALAAAAEAAGDISLLLSGDDRYAAFAWEVLSNTLCYAASLVPGVNESPAAVDDAMKLGFNWVRGPFELLDELGVDRFAGRLEQEGRRVPAFLDSARGGSFYRVERGSLRQLESGGGFRPVRRAPGIRRFGEERKTLTPIRQNRVASYFEVDPGIGLVEFHSKANTLDGASMQLLADAVEHASGQFQGLIVHNDAAHFSCGVNLSVVLEFIVAEDWTGLDRFLADFQATVLAMKHAPIPVVAAPAGLSLGGGFEVVLHADKAIFHANSVTGLVESLVGVVPAGGGVKETLYRWYERSGDVAKAAWKTFMQVGYGRTAASPVLAREHVMFRDGVDEFAMNRDRMLERAVQAVGEMAVDYEAQRRGPLPLAGAPEWKRMQEWLHEARDGGRLTPHDVTTGTRIAMIATGGDVDPGTEMSENGILALERQAFLALARTSETRARIEHMLRYGSPLRN